MNKFPGFSFEKIKENGVVKMLLVHSTNKLSSPVLTKLYEGESAQSEIGKTIQMAIELGKIPETKCQVRFITGFGDFMP